jgi:hypothetical protein
MVPQTAPVSSVLSHTRTLRLGSVSYLNARPLVYGLESAGGLRLSFDVPSTACATAASTSRCFR